MKAAQEHARDLKAKLWAIKWGIGFSIPNRADKSTWVLDFPPDTTDEQKAAAQKVIREYEHSTDPNDQ